MIYKKKRDDKEGKGMEWDEIKRKKEKERENECKGKVGRERKGIKRKERRRN